MGYRSDLAYTVRFQSDDDRLDRQSFYVFLAEIRENELTSTVIDELEIDEKNYAINFRADSVKWYDSYPDVQAHERIIEIANDWCNDEDNNSGIWYEKARIGEELDDNHYMANAGKAATHGDSVIDISRRIVTDWD